MRAAALRIIKLLFTCERRDAHSRRSEGRGAAYRKINMNIKVAAFITVDPKVAVCLCVIDE